MIPCGSTLPQSNLDRCIVGDCRDVIAVGVKVGSLLQSDFLDRIASALLHALQGVEKITAILQWNTSTVGVTAKRVDIPLQNNRLPYRVLISLLRVQRIAIKQRNDDLNQILNFLGGPTHAWVGLSVRPVSRDIACLQRVLDVIDDVRIVVTKLDSDIYAELCVPRIAATLACEQSDTALAIKQASKPVAKRVRDVQSARNALTVNALRKCIPDVDLVTESISLRDTFHASTGHGSHFGVAPSGEQQVSLNSGDLYATSRTIPHANLRDRCCKSTFYSISDARAGTEINPAYVEMQKPRTAQQGMPI